MKTAALLAVLLVAFAPLGARAAGMSGQRVSGKAIAALATAQLAHLIRRGDTEFVPASTVSDQIVSDGRVHLRAQSPMDTPSFVNVPVQIEVDGRLDRTVLVGYRVQQYVQTAIASRDLVAGTVLAADDLRLARVPFTGQPGNGTDALVGRRAELQRVEGTSDRARPDRNRPNRESGIDRRVYRPRRQRCGNGRCNCPDRRRPGRASIRLQSANAQTTLGNRYGPGNRGIRYYRRIDAVMKTVALTLACLLLPATALADTLYVSPPPSVGPGHPLRLGPDHRASQVGDLLHVQFNFSVQSFSSDVSSSTKQASAGSSSGATGTSGVSILGFIKVPLSVGGQTATQSSRTENGQTTFVSDMEATVIGVLPSGALEVAGDQLMAVNGQNQKLHIVGYVRPEDIDATDTVLSSRMADVQGTFSGNFQEKNVGLIRRILNWLF